jgi:hypothetical protein
MVFSQQAKKVRTGQKKQLGIPGLALKKPRVAKKKAKTVLRNRRVRWRYGGVSKSLFYLSIFTNKITSLLTSAVLARIVAKVFLSNNPTACRTEPSSQIKNINNIESYEKHGARQKYVKNFDVYPIFVASL